MKLTPEGDHDGVQGWGRVLDAPVNPPVLGVGLLNNVVARLVSLDGDHLLAIFLVYFK